MKPNDYKFEIGDKVITVYGEVGRIVDICKCDSCIKRGFREPIWLEDLSGDRHYITNYMADTGFDEFYQIGEYRFDNPFAKSLVGQAIAHHERMLARYQEGLRVIEELEAEKESK